MISADQIRSAPAWVLILIAAFLIFTVVGGPIFAGWRLERIRTAPARRAEFEGAKRWIETGELDLKEIRALERANSATAQMLAIPAGGLVLRPQTAIFEPDDAERIMRQTGMPFVEPTKAQPIVEEPEPEEPETEEIPTELASWMLHQTQEWSLDEILEAEVVETETEAERLFAADPLRSWVLPPLEEVDFLPEADRAFRDLVARNWLTGEGADISTEWEAWNLAPDLEESFA